MRVSGQMNLEREVGAVGFHERKDIDGDSPVGLADRAHSHRAQPDVRAAVREYHPGDGHQVVQARIGIAVVGIEHLPIEENQHVDHRRARCVRGVIDGRAGNAFVDVAHAVAIGVGENVHVTYPAG